jgi:hypothetical protein
VRAAALGVISAVAELGAAQTWVALNDPPERDVLAFGAGASSMEALSLLGYGVASGGPSDDHLGSWAEGARHSRLVRHSLFAERFSATVLHVASRSLVAIGIRRRRPAAVVLPALLFAAVDGVASYGHAAGWIWVDPATARRFYAFLAAVNTVEVAQLARAARR